VRVLGAEGVVLWVRDSREGSWTEFRERVTGVTESHHAEGKGRAKGHEGGKGGGVGG